MIDAGYEEAIQEVRRRKEIVSRRIEELGSAEFHRQAALENAVFLAEVEAARKAKLAKAQA